MKTILRTYTHPVLGNGDDFNSRFDVEFDVGISADKENWLITPKIRIDDKYLQQLIEEGFAAYHLEVECPSTFYRHSFDTRKQEEQFAIPSSRLRGKVRLEAYLVALNAIPAYSPTQIHQDYGQRTYSIAIGEILGVGGGIAFVADIEFDPLRASANSFIKIERGPAAKGNMEALHGQNEIIIRLPQEDYDRFQDVAGQKLVEDILHATIVFPVLLEAVRFAQKNHNDKNDRLVAILEQRGLMREEPFAVAQQILQAPVSRALAKIQQIKETVS